MNHLLAKTKGARGKYLKVISGKKIFDQPDTLENAIKYDNGTNLDEDQWFFIDNFSSEVYCPDFLKRDFISTDYSQIKIAEYPEIDYLVAYQHGKYYFQKLSKRQFLEKKYFTINPQPKFYENSKIIIIEHLPNAIYIKSKKTLYFKNLTHIQSIFTGIETLYKEATKEETETFLQKSFITLKNNFNADQVKQMNRKRIALAIDALNKIPIKQHEEIFKYIYEYRPALKYDDKSKSFEVSNESELKDLLYGLTERYYTTRFGMEKRLANSVIKLD